jgi:hypothetical protein
MTLSSNSQLIKMEAVINGYVEGNKGRALKLGA